VAVNLDRALGVGREPHGSSDDPDVLDFSANTNPEVPDGVEGVYHEAFETARSYPPEPPDTYREAAADYVGVRLNAVVPTPGGLATIRLATALAVDPGDTALVPFPSFAEYAREVRLQGGDPEFVPADAILDADPTGHALAVVCDPNNPTGRGYDREVLLAFAARCREAGTTLLLDEAFLGFTDRRSLAGTEGVVVARSLTKLFGLPGIRAGFAVADGSLREGLLNARRAWNVGAPALAVGAYCMRQSAFVARTRERVARERERLCQALGERFDVFPSEAPFLTFEVGDVDGLLAHAASEGLALRDARTFRGLDSHVRVAVRLPNENDRLLEVLNGV
jgi:histidinol-phosphate/aromatic aminotransferase/cobyric acid decarboxylase-like protein